MCGYFQARDALHQFVFQWWDVVYSVAADVACKLFISSGNDPGSWFACDSSVWSHKRHTIPRLHQGRKKQTVNPNKCQALLPPPTNIVLNAHCSAVTWKYCWDVIGKSSGYYIRQTMLSNFSKWYADHFARGQNWIFCWDVILGADCISAKGEWRREPFINHSLTLLLHYPKLTFSQPLSVSHQNSIIPVKAVWIVG